MEEAIEVNRASSFRGRKYQACAFSYRKGLKNVIVFNWNIIGKTMVMNKELSDEEAILHFIGIDFHEWLHIWLHWNIRGIGKYPDNAERFVLYAHGLLVLTIGLDVLTSFLIVPMDEFINPELLSKK